MNLALHAFDLVNCCKNNLNGIGTLHPDIIGETVRNLQCDGTLESFAACGEIFDFAFNFVEIVAIHDGFQFVRQVLNGLSQFCVILLKEKPLHLIWLVLYLVFAFFRNLVEVEEDIRVGECSATAEQKFNGLDPKVELEPLILDVFELLVQLRFVIALIELDRLLHNLELCVVIGQSSHVCVLQGMRFYWNAIVWPIILPGVYANPTELVLALPASDVIASAVLLDVRFAIWTRLGESHDPVGSFQSRFFDFFELLHQLARYHVMDFCVAGEAELETANANHGGLILSGDIDFDCVGTVGRLTPSNEAVVQDEPACDQLLVFWFQLLRQQVNDEVILDRHITGVARAFDAVHEIALSYCCFDVLLETGATEVVTAVQFVNLLKKVELQSLDTKTFCSYLDLAGLSTNVAFLSLVFALPSPRTLHCSLRDCFR